MSSLRGGWCLNCHAIEANDFGPRHFDGEAFSEQRRMWLKDLKADQLTKQSMATSRLAVTK
jgi:hypothetical protein